MLLFSTSEKNCGALESKCFLEVLLLHFTNSQICYGYKVCKNFCFPKAFHEALIDGDTDFYPFDSRLSLTSTPQKSELKQLFSKLFQEIKCKCKIDF